MITYDKVSDEINALFFDAWNTNAGFVGYVPEVRWQNVQELTIPEDKFWCRLHKETVFEQQKTLSTCEMIPGQRMYTASGLIFVQLFLPKSHPQAFELGQQLAVVARNAFRGKASTNHIWFRNVRINELNPEHAYFRINVIAEFEYDELG